ncbi:MFS transporter [Nitrospinota bacterium]
MNRGLILGLMTTGHAAEHWYLGIMGPVLPFLIEDLDITFTQVGILFAGRAVFSAISSAGTGFATDRLGGGKWVFVVCLGGIALLHGGMSLTTGFLSLLPIYWLTGMVSHLWHPPSMGLLSERFSHRKGFALGLHGTGASIGQTIAPLVAGYLLLIMGWRGVLAVNMAPLVAVAILIGWWLPPFRPEQRKSEGSEGLLRLLCTSIFQNPALGTTALISGAVTVGHNGVATFLPILLITKHGVSPEWVGLCLAIFSGSAIVPEPIVGYISDRISRKFVLIFGLTAGGISLILTPSLAPGPLILIPLVTIGIFLRSLRTVIFAHALDVSPPHLRGSTVGLLFTTNQGFSVVGPLAAGMLSDIYGVDSALWLFGGITLMILPLFAFLPKFPDKEGDQTGPTAEADSTAQTL